MVNKHAARSLRLGGVLATLSGFQYSFPLLDESYGSRDDSPGLEAFVQGSGLLIVTHSGLFNGRRQCLAQSSFSTYFRKVSRYCVV